MALDAGTKVGRYTITRLVAQGGMAEVYRAEQELTSGISRPAAVKVIRPEYSESPEFREMFLDEARTACTLSHPNIVHIYEVGETDEGLLYMAMELVTGETLSTIGRTLRQADERFSDEAVFAIGIATCSALEAVHQLKTEGGTVNLVHRDVSPHNLLLSSSGSLKLIDFGIAKAATNRNLTMPGVTKGKAGYFSPEQAMGKPLDGRSDLFSLGVTLYKLASGGTPFDDFKDHIARHQALVKGNFQPLSAVMPGLPQGLYEVVDRSLQVKKEDRYQSAGQMREALERAAFDAGLRLGQSSLTGYVTTDGEITAVGGSRTSLTPSKSVPSQRAAVSAGTLAPTLKRPVTAPTGVRAQKRPPLLLLSVLFAAALTIGLFGVLLAFGAKEPPKVVTLGGPVARLSPPAPPPPPSPRPLVVPPLEQVVEAPPAPAPEPAPSPAPVRPSKPLTRPVPVRLAPDEPIRHPRAVKPEPKATVPEEPAPVIPAGEGKLRISATDPSAVASILVGGEDWGSPPVNKKVSSGLYVVTLKLADGKRSLPWKGPVQPDRTTALVYDVGSGKWTAQ